MSYIFNTKAPPLLSEVDNIIDVPSESLLKRVGDSQWDAFRTKKTGGGSGSFPTVKRVLKIKTHYKMSRRLQWVVDQAPMHYSTDVSFEQTIKEGYSEQRKTTMEKSLGISAGASIPFAGLGANVKSDLKLTEEVTTSWSREKVSKVNRSFKAGHTYVGWQLLDVLTLDKLITTRVCDWGESLLRKISENQVIDFVVVLSRYEDEWGGGQPPGLSLSLVENNLEAPDLPRHLVQLSRI